MCVLEIGNPVGSEVKLCWPMIKRSMEDGKGVGSGCRVKCLRFKDEEDVSSYLKPLSSLVGWSRLTDDEV